MSHLDPALHRFTVDGYQHAHSLEEAQGNVWCAGATCEDCPIELDESDFTVLSSKTKAERFSDLVVEWEEEGYGGRA